MCFAFCPPFKDEYGYKYPCVKARGIIDGSAEEVMGMIVDSTRVSEYNRFVRYSVRYLIRFSVRYSVGASFGTSVGTSFRHFVRYFVRHFVWYFV